MKKIVAVLITLVFVLGLATVSMADCLLHFKGTVVAVDETASTITVRDDEYYESVFVLDPEDMLSAKKGMQAKIFYHVEFGWNIADEVWFKPPRKAAQGC